MRVLSVHIWTVCIVSVVTIVRRGAGVVPDWTEVTVVTSVLEGSVWCACLRQSRHVMKQGSTSPCPPRGHDGGKVTHLSIMRLLLGEGVMITHGLGAWPALLGFC